MGSILRISICTWHVCDVRANCWRRWRRYAFRGPNFRIGRLYSPKTLWQGIRLARYIRTNLIQIVHSYGFYPNVFTVPIARLAGASIVVASIRDTGDMLTPLQRRLQRIVCRLADCVLVNAEAIRRNLLEQGYDASNIVVIRNGIRLSKFTGRERGATLRRELGIPLSAPLVAVFSRLNRMKGVQYFLDAAILLLQKFPEAYFLVAGDGGSRKELEERACRSGSWAPDRVYRLPQRCSGPAYRKLRYPCSRP